VLVDTSVWVDHFRRGNERLAEGLRRGRVWTHTFVIGELACGNLTRRSEILALLAMLPHAPQVGHQEALAFVESRRLVGAGLGWIDVHLLASATLARVGIWSLDRRLASAAHRLAVSGR
jgi:predicted nucleic acid-binding protein